MRLLKTLLCAMLLLVQSHLLFPIKKPNTYDPTAGSCLPCVVMALVVMAQSSLNYVTTHHGITIAQFFPPKMTHAQRFEETKQAHPPIYGQEYEQCPYNFGNSSLPNFLNSMQHKEKIKND